MTPDNDKNKTFAVQYLPKVTGLHKVRQFEDFVGRKTRTELRNVFVIYGGCSNSDASQ